MIDPRERNDNFQWSLDLSEFVEFWDYLDERIVLLEALAGIQKSTSIMAQHINRTLGGE